jgi:hypothetical protein
VCFLLDDGIWKTKLSEPRMVKQVDNVCRCNSLDRRFDLDIHSKPIGDNEESTVSVGFRYTADKSNEISWKRSIAKDHGWTRRPTGACAEDLFSTH